MLRLRLELQPKAELKEVCAQATRIATQLGVEVVFDYLDNEAVAKPGMDPDSLLNEFLNEAKAPEPKEPVKPKETSKKGGKGKEATEVVAPTPDANPADVQKESI